MSAVVLQLTNDIEKAKKDIAAAEKRRQEVEQLVQQAKQGKEDTVSETSQTRRLTTGQLQPAS